MSESNPYGNYGSNTPTQDPLSLLFAQVRGRHTPIQYADPDPKGTLEQALYAALANVDKNITDYKVKSMDVWSQSAKTGADLAGALSQIYNAEALSQEAKSAVVAALYDRLSVLAAEGAYGIADEKEVVPFADSSRKAVRTLEGAVRSGGLDNGFRDLGDPSQWVTNTGDMSPKLVELYDTLDAQQGVGSETWSAKASEYSNRGQGSPAVGDTLGEMEGIMLRDITSLLPAVTERFLPTNFAKLDKAGQAAAVVDARAKGANFLEGYAARHVDLIESGPNAAVTPDVRAQLVNRRERAKKDAALMETLAQQYGLASGPAKQQIMGAMETVFTTFRKGGPAVAAELNKMEVDPFMLAEHNMIVGRLTDLSAARAGGRGDPLDTAVANFSSEMPGFADWMTAMGFNNRERAVIYAANHPREISAWVDYHDSALKDPNTGNLLDIGEARKHLQEVAKTEPVGFYTTEAGRLFQPHRRADELPPEMGPKPEEMGHIEAQMRESEAVANAGEDITDAEERRAQHEKERKGKGAAALAMEDVDLWRKAPIVTTAEGDALKRLEDGRIMVVYSKENPEFTGKVLQPGEEPSGAAPLFTGQPGGANLYETMQSRYDAAGAAAAGAPQGGAPAHKPTRPGAAPGGLPKRAAPTEGGPTPPEVEARVGVKPTAASALAAGVVTREGLVGGPKLQGRPTQEGLESLGVGARGRKLPGERPGAPTSVRSSWGAMARKASETPMSEDAAAAEARKKEEQEKRNRQYRQPE